MALNQKLLQEIKKNILRGWLFGNFTCTTVKFHGCHHAIVDPYHKENLDCPNSKKPQNMKGVFWEINAGFM